MKRKGRLISLLVIFTLLVGIVGAFNIEATYAASKKIHLKKTTVTVIVGKTYTQKLISKSGKIIKGSYVKWNSKKTSIATITKKGTIKALKKGTVKMTAKYKGKTYSFTVKVKTNADSAKIVKYLGNANKYAEYMHSDLSKMIYYNFFSWNLVERDASYAAVKNDLKQARSWLKKAKAISGAKGFTVWDSKIDNLIYDSTDALAEKPDFSSMEALDPYTVKVEKASKGIIAIYNKVCGK